MQSLLNKPLYAALRVLYGDVEVVARGDKGNYVRQVNTTVKDGASREYVNYNVQPGGSYGEQYRLDCPWCGDTRKRLYVSYLFGMRDPVTRFVNYGNIHCYNESCHTDYYNKKDLYDDIQLAGFSDFASSDEDIHGHDSQGGGELLDRGEVSRPGYMVPFSQIPPSSPAYRAVTYLRDDRGFDVDMLESYYGVQYLARAHRLKVLNGRIWTPMYRGGVLTAWTARAVPGLSDTEIPHFHSPGGLGGLVYGLGGALKCRVLCIVEGVSDKWAVGRPGVALLSKKLGHLKCQRLFADIYSSSVEAVVVLLDPDQPESELEKGQVHHIQETVDTVTKYWSGLVFPVYLPSGTDPGGCSRDFISKYLFGVLKSYGYTELGQVLARDVYGSSAARIGFNRAGGK